MKFDKKLFLILFGDSILFAGIIIAITVLWQLLELLAYGEIRPSEVDTIIAMLLGISLYINLKTLFKLW
ncbi:MAG: hypothetical protein MSA15_01310 [Clostridium sp.]|nr:hypothetical protein [Clostridium sp.]